MNKLKIEGHFHGEVFEADGVTKVAEIDFDNSVVNAALQDMLAVYFNSGTQKTAFYMGLIDNSGFSALNIGDTIASHAGWSENTAYGSATRPAWTPNAPTILNPGASITTNGTVNFTMNSSVTIHGAFIATDSTKSGVAGLLISEGALSANQALVNTQILKLTWSCTITATN